MRDMRLVGMIDRQLQRAFFESLQVYSEKSGGALATGDMTSRRAGGKAEVASRRRRAGGMLCPGGEAVEDDQHAEKDDGENCGAQQA